MLFKKSIALALSAILTISCTSMPTAVSAAADYGSITANADGSIELTFGADSITTSGGGSVADDSDNPGYVRPDNLKTNSDGIAVLTMPEIDLSATTFNKLDLYVASQKDAAVTFACGGTTIATIDNVNNGQWHTYTTYTADIITTEASGNLTLTITGNSKTYCGNYVYVKLYDTNAPVVEDEVPVYLDTTRSFEERAADLVSRMTLEEKVAQLGYKAAAIERLGVNSYDYWKEALHGVARQGQATSFPVPLAMSNTWNRDLIYRLADITSTEARAKNNRYNLSYWSPTVNMARDPRWGRNDETMGEDPYLTGQLGSEFVRGMQGNDETYLKTISTLKHFAANNNEANRRGGTSVVNEFDFRNYYTKVYQNITEEVMPASVMSSYNGTTLYRNGELVYNYKPSAANSYLLTDLLRRNWGFTGYVTSDCGAGEDLINNAAYKLGMLGSSSEENEAYIAEALLAGMNVECNLSGGNRTTEYGVAAVENGYMTEEELETVVYELFLQRFKTGEFDDESSYRNITSSVIESDAHVAVAEAVAEETWVLLKNEDSILPLSENVTKVAVVGNMADTLALGDYSAAVDKLTHTVTPYEGMAAEIDAEVSHLGAVTDDELLFNVKSVKFVLKNGSTRTVDLSKATGVSGMTLTSGTLTDVTPAASAVIANVDFSNVVSVQVEMATGDRMGGSINFAYGSGGPTVASVLSSETASTSTYVVCEGEYTGEDGGYNGTADMYISATPAVLPFSVEAYKSELEEADVIIAYAGTVPKQDGFGTADSSESKDRSSINLPDSQSHVEEITSSYPEKTIVVMQTVGQINVEPFMDDCKAILWTSYNGQTQGTALGKVLTGEVNPSGKLSTTWYKNSDITKMELANKTKKTIDGINGYYTDYSIRSDSTNPGHTYQYYTNTPVYPFGYGLSYTTFEYSNLKLDKETVNANGRVTVTVDVTNTGSVSGKEAVQLYISHPQDSDEIPAKQLKGFEKISLAPGETKTVTFKLDVKDFNLFSEENRKLYVPTGEYTITVGKNALDNSTAAKLTVTGTLESMLKNIVALPDGITLNGAICEDGTGLESLTKIDAGLSAITTDEVWVNLSLANASVLEGSGSVLGDSSLTLTYSNGAVTVNSTESGTAVVVCASYTDGVLTGVQTSDVTLIANEAVLADGITANVGDKLMLWDSLEKINPICAPITAGSSDEAALIFASSDTDIATVSADGIVSSGEKEGVATISVSLTMNGVTKSTSFPVVNSLEIKPSDEEIEAAKALVTDTYENLPKAAYSDENLASLKELYETAIAEIESTLSASKLENIVLLAINSLNSVPMDNLTEAYSIASVNENYIRTGLIDYRDGGIPMYSGATGTVTNSNPHTGIQLQAYDENGEAIDNSNIIWQVQKFDSSVRKVAEITTDGILSIYGNGIIQITAANIEDMTCGRLMVHVNMQIEGEYADDANGADLNDAQSGTSGGKDAGSTGDAWIEYKSVKLSNLENIVARYAGKNSGAINISLDRSASSDTLLATATANATGGWSTWSEVEFDVKSTVIENAQLNGILDEYGCATIYIQTNGINLDYFRLNYIENNDDIPYIIEKTLNKANGNMKATLKYRGSTLATEVELVALNLISGEMITTPVKGSGEYVLSDVASDGDILILTVCDADGNELSEPYTAVYNTPVDSTIVVYSLDDSNYDYTALTGGTDSVAYTSTVNGLSGYGSWTLVSKSANYTYTDVNEKTYDYSFTQAWQSGQGSTSKRCLYFTPEGPCKVTALFNGSEAARSMTIYQSSSNSITQPGTGSPVAFSLEVTDASAPVYIYGGSSNKQLYAIIVEYYGLTATLSSLALSAEDYDRAVQYVDWNGTTAVLTKNDLTGETKVWTQLENGTRSQLDTDYFYFSDVSYSYDDEYTINSLAVYKDRLYAACDGGLVIMFTPCAKCYQLKKLSCFDNKSMTIKDSTMTLSDGTNTLTYDMTDIGGDSIEAEEALLLNANGAVLVDVRTSEEFAEYSYDGSVNIPLDSLSEGLSSYPTDTTFIFYCASGVRSANAVKTAKALGYENVYNLGSIDKLM